MTYDTIRTYCLAKIGTTESLPFDPQTLVIKVANKIFILMSLDSLDNPSVNLKCDPEKAIELRETHAEAIKPGYHMNKKHWNTVSISQGLPNKLLQDLIDHSYDLVVQSLPKKAQAHLASNQ